MSTTISALNRADVLGESAVVAPRIVHLGLGAFHRAHQAWYTAHAADAAEWTIAAFTGRGPKAADELAPQDGLYTLIERGPEGDRAEIMAPIVEADRADDLTRLRELLAAPATALVTLTITEPAYRLRADGSPTPTTPRSSPTSPRFATAVRRPPRSDVSSPDSRPAARRRQARSRWCRATTSPTTVHSCAPA